MTLTTTKVVYVVELPRAHSNSPVKYMGKRNYVVSTLEDAVLYKSHAAAMRGIFKFYKDDPDGGKCIICPLKVTSTYEWAWA